MADWKLARDAEVDGALRAVASRAALEKEEGNRLFKEGKYCEAYTAYKRGVDLFEGFCQPALTGEPRRLLATLCCNAAQALLRSGVDGATGEGARRMADRALALEPTNA